MARKLGIVGLALPLIAIVGALIFLFAYGTDAPTFEAGPRELARTNTVVQLSQDPSAALVVPEQAPQSMPILVILADDQRHIWQAVTDLELLPLVEAEEVGLLIAPGVDDASTMAALVEEIDTLVGVDAAALTGFDGGPIRMVCAEWNSVWNGVIVAAATDVSCGQTAVAVVEPGDGLGVRVIDALRQFLELRASK